MVPCLFFLLALYCTYRCCSTKYIRKEFSDLSDTEKRSHDLTLTVIAEIISRDFNIMKNSDQDENEVREVFAASVLDEYNFFFDVFKKSIK